MYLQANGLLRNLNSSHENNQNLGLVVSINKINHHFYRCLLIELNPRHPHNENAGEELIVGISENKNKHNETRG